MFFTLHAERRNVGYSYLILKPYLAILVRIRACREVQIHGHRHALLQLQAQHGLGILTHRLAIDAVHTIRQAKALLVEYRRASLTLSAYLTQRSR